MPETKNQSMLEIRLTSIMDLLKTEDLTSKEIAFRLGFSYPICLRVLKILKQNKRVIRINNKYTIFSNKPITDNMIICNFCGELIIYNN